MKDEYRETALRISRRLLAPRPRPGWRLAADGQSLIRCTRHRWDWINDRRRACRYCLQVREEP